MKRLLVILLFCLPFFSTAQGVFGPGTQLGVRLGGGINYGSGVEVTYIHPLSDINRLDFTMPVWFDGDGGSIHLNGYYEFMKPIGGDFQLFGGPGAGLGLTWYDNNKDNKDTGIVINIGAIGGVVYQNENLPFDLDFTIRPTFITLNNYGDSFNLYTAIGILFRL